MIGIVVTTYKRPDGQTPFFLNRALRSVMTQTYEDYRIYLIGDDYTDRNEFDSIAKQYKKITAVNLLFSIERQRYKFGDYRLFCSGGVTPALEGISLALADGCQYVCHLDHDDWWEPAHLAQISSVFNRDPVFIATIATYYGSYLPLTDPTNEIIDYLPRPGGSSLSASCIKYSDTDVRFRDVYAETGKEYPADADFWERLSAQMNEKGQRGYLISTVTVHHDNEGYSFRGSFNE